uniref:NADH-ubiquinone oxidoreductase chain 3 n=1 Tax=Orbilia brochopaga TaxID=3140254 RepID=A0A481ZN51_9PEZI|nr:NADH dehydrogenase subunit 3 [Drechslerella brochopaga]QBL02507.1 NADH dehydrogenase subunit 3 [Drechslerella brochopaga]
MNSLSFYILLIPIINILLLSLNVLLGPDRKYGEKRSSFECGFHSFLGQNRQPFNISFFLFGLLFLIFDLEIILIFPYTLSANHNASYGLTVLFAFFIILTVPIFILTIDNIAVWVKIPLYKKLIFYSLCENVNLLYLLFILSVTNYGENFTLECFYSLSIILLAIYDNADTDKLLILKENKGKSGVYRWINKKSGKSYIGSSINLSRRFLEYFNTNYLLKKS